MNDHPDTDPIDGLLREEPGYIEDDGFTARVIAALPARRSLAWLRPALILGATVLSLALIIRWLPEQANAFASVAHTAPGSEALGIWVVGTSLIASIVWGAVAALRSEQ